MCEPTTIALGIAAMSVAMSAGSAVMQQQAKKADYNSKVQVQQANTEMARSEREATHQTQIRDRAAAERKFSADSMESTLKAEELRGEALAQGANFSVASAVFDQTERHIYMADQNNQTSNIWNLQNNARNIEAASQSDYRKQKNRMWQSRAGNAPGSAGMWLGIGKGVLGAASSGLSAYGAATDAGL